MIGEARGEASGDEDCELEAEAAEEEGVCSKAGKLEAKREVPKLARVWLRAAM